jgi:hypothetical protein
MKKITLSEQISRARILMGYNSEKTLLENEYMIFENEEIIAEQLKNLLRTFSDDAIKLLSGEVKGMAMFGDDAVKATEFLKRARAGKAAAGELGTFTQGVLKDTKMVKSNPGLYDDAVVNYTKELMNSQSSLAKQFKGASAADRRMLLKNAGYPETAINKIVKQADNLGGTAVKSADDVAAAVKTGDKVTDASKKSVLGTGNQKLPQQFVSNKTPLKTIDDLKVVAKNEPAAMSAFEKAGYNIGKYGAGVAAKIAALRGKISIKQALLYGLAGYGAYELVKGLFGKDGKNADGVLPSCVANLPDVQFVVGTGDVVVAKIPDGVDEKSKNHQGLFFWPNNRAITGDGQVRGTYYCKGTSGGGETVSATVSEQDTAGGTSDIHIDWDGAKSGTGGSGEGGISSGPARTRFTNCDSKELPHAFGCKSDYVREVQQCLGLPQKYQTGNFGPITQKALTDAGYNGSEIDKTTHEKITSNCNGTTGSTVTDTPVKRLNAEPITLAPRDITSLKVPTSLSIPDLIKNLKPISPNTQPSDERQAEIIRGVTDRGFDMVYKGGALTDDEKMWMLKHYGAEEGINKTKVKGDGQEKLRFN